MVIDMVCSHSMKKTRKIDLETKTRLHSQKTYACMSIEYHYQGEGLTMA